MGWFGNDDVILDEEAFDKAARDFTDLSERLRVLKGDIETMLENLKTGFDTPAGRKFIQSCESNLLEPIEKQKTVLDHISETLNEVRSSYSEVFTDYEELNQEINSHSY